MQTHHLGCPAPACPGRQYRLCSPAATASQPAGIPGPANAPPCTCTLATTALRRGAHLQAVVAVLVLLAVHVPAANGVLKVLHGRQHLQTMVRDKHLGRPLLVQPCKAALRSTNSCQAGATSPTQVSPDGGRAPPRAASSCASLLTFRSKNWLSSPYLACTGATRLQAAAQREGRGRKAAKQSEPHSRGSMGMGWLPGALPAFPQVPRQPDVSLTWRQRGGQRGGRPRWPGRARRSWQTERGPS